MNATNNLAILIFPDVELLDFCGPFEVFSVASRQTDLPAFHVFTVAESLEPITARNGLSVNPQFRFVDCPQAELLLVPGGIGTRTQMHNPTLIDWIKRTAATAELVMSVCTGALLLGKAGLLDGLEATTPHSSLCNAFVSNYVPSRGYGRGARVVLEAMEEGQDYKHWTNELFPGGSFGNGAAMRVAPIGLFFHDDLDRVWEQARLSSLPTHVHPLGIEGAQLLALAVALCLRQSEFDHSGFFESLRHRSTTTDFQDRLGIAAVASTAEDLTRLGNGIAAQDSVVTAIACFTLFPDCYEDVISNAILLGGDTDTIAAMAGAISGAYLGVGSIPSQLLECVEDYVKGRSYIADLAKKLCASLA